MYTYINIIKKEVCTPKTNLHGNVVFLSSNTAGKLSFNLSIILIDIWMLRASRFSIVNRRNQMVFVWYLRDIWRTRWKIDSDCFIILAESKLEEKLFSREMRYEIVIILTGTGITW